ncbi:alpha/beta hydrolase [Streptomyces luomodiensis]|uniref:Alpha/beta hydrolase n=1 Tax=Streptomyces luomodiensis TaxID=3026192 RepID=A0ABY9V7F7_9ACTN|nr:alpha/beta hydrolase [Streptomyces sp. SCA4-21]WNF00818.1 alpha/beta hydrolase [Streptomyces sp. SCA4-21]
MYSAPPFDAELAAALAATGQDSIATGITRETIAAHREALLADVPSIEELSQDGAFDVEERTVPGPEGAPDISLLILRPTGWTGARPVVYHTHGGGLIMGNNRFGIEQVTQWALELGLVVVSVEYRLAPEHPYPAGLDDAYAGLLWTVRNAESIGGDPRRVLVAGGSAGGNLAAALALLARDRKEVELLAQVLIYPMLDDRNETVSAHQMAGRGAWDRVSNDTAWTAVLGSARRSDDVPAYASPARETDLAGLPPAFLEVGAAETFRDEVVAYAGRIWASGGEAELHVWPGAFHGFDVFAPHAAISQDACNARLRWLRRLLGE